MAIGCKAQHATMGLPETRSAEMAMSGYVLYWIVTLAAVLLSGQRTLGKISTDAKPSRWEVECVRDCGGRAIGNRFRLQAWLGWKKVQTHGQVSRSACILTRHAALKS